MASDIFLSYCRADRPLAERFVSTAAARGVDVWFDEEIEGGEDWREKIVDALGSAKALVILFSDHSNASRQLIKELAIADNLQKPIVPVLVSNCEPKGAYLYEMASRNWIKIHPHPETRLASLVDKLITELELHGGSPTPAAVNAATAPPAQPVTPAAPPTVLPPMPPAAPAHDADERWFPLGRYDLYILVPILVGSLLIGIFGKGDDKSAGLGVSAIAFSIYMLVIGVRNARLNRSVFSGKSFASYFAVLVIGFSTALVSGESAGENITAFGGLIIISLLLAVIANVVQVILRKIFQRKIFHSRIDKPLVA
jgi:TIR domain